MRLAVFTKNRTNPAYAAARIGAERAASRMGADVVHFVPHKADDIAEQIALTDDALAGGFDAFVLVPVHASAVDEAVARVLAAGIPVVNYLNRLAKGKFVSFVGCDDVCIGHEIATHLARHLNGRGGLVIIEGMPGAVTSQDRVRGFSEALTAFEGMRVLARLQGAYQEAEGRAAMEAFLAGPHPAFDAVLAANDSMALGAIAALQASSLSVPVTGINAIPQAIAAVMRGELLATVAFDAMSIACIATEAAIRHLRGERVPREIMLPAGIVDASNCAAWAAPLEERVCLRWDDVCGHARPQRC